MITPPSAEVFVFDPGNGKTEFPHLPFTPWHLRPLSFHHPANRTLHSYQLPIQPRYVWFLVSGLSRQP